VGGEDWKAGSSHAISWAATDNLGVTGVDLAYSTDGGATFPATIAAGLTNSGSYPWTVPNTPGSAVRVRVMAHDAAGNLGADSSAANFTISTWTISASGGPGGSVVPSGVVPVVEGANQHFSIAPEPGNHVASLMVDGSPVPPDTVYAFASVAAHHTLAATFAPAVSTTVVISEFRTNGPNGGSDEFVELYNLSDSPVSIGGWLVRGSNSSAGTTTRATITAGVVLGAYRHYLLTNRSTSGGPYSGSVVGDQTYSTGITDTGGIALIDGTTVVDQVGMSTGSAYKEGTVLAPLLGNLNQSYERKPGGVGGSGQDTDDNASDFQVRAPSDPQNLTSGTVSVVSLTGIGLELSSPQPNPSQSGTLLRFSLPAEGRVQFTVLDVAGRQVWRQIAVLGPGFHEVMWNGLAEGGSRVGTGLYFVRLTTPWGTRTERLVRLQ
jgi:hypothetical protein